MKTFWFTGREIAKDTKRGKELRKMIADLGDQCDLRQLDIPSKYKKVLKAFKRVDGATNQLYEGADRNITLLEWVQHWRWASKGTAPGPSGLTHDLMAALTCVGNGTIDTEAQAEAAVGPTSKAMLLLVNMTLRLKRVPQLWKKRAIRVVPKAPGEIDIGNVTEADHALRGAI